MNDCKKKRLVIGYVVMTSDNIMPDVEVSELFSDKNLAGAYLNRRYLDVKNALKECYNDLIASDKYVENDNYLFITGDEDFYYGCIKEITLNTDV